MDEARLHEFMGKLVGDMGAVVLLIVMAVLMPIIEINQLVQ
ncbi:MULTISPECIES: hypothetical protein [Pseudomonas]|jgi:type II secretory pathway component PulF|nr:MULTISPECIES: hypothetical protein [Pseudomonas]PZW82451.1 hypothetical protein DFS21_104245 [Pseudomonas sp. 2848]